MTAIPIPSLSRLEETEQKEMFETSTIRKDLTSAFATPAVVRKKISRLSHNFQQLPAECIKVFLRLRPFTEEEVKNNEKQQCMKISDDRHILTAMAPKESKIFKASNRGIGEPVRHYTFTSIFDHTVGQKEFYRDSAHPLVRQFIEGNDALIFTYGVTNSGKTYTLQGTPGNEGIIPQSIGFLFDQIGDKLLENVTFIPKMAKNLCLVDDDELRSRESMKGVVLSMAEESRLSFGRKSQQTSLGSSSLCDSIETSIDEDAASSSKMSSKESYGQLKGPLKYAVFVSFVEVYRELVYDLLVPVTDEKRKSRPVLVIADDKKGTSYVKGMREIQVNSPEELLKVLSVGQNHLHVAATKLNKDSSRSHCIFTITLVQVMDIPDPHGARVSKISFCDLAGSERANKTGEAGDRLKEAGKINTSLMKLGMCIADLRHNQRYKDDKTKQKAVFFRESKLTRLFRNYLLGDGCACMIVNANMCASDFDETAHVLKFSAIAKEVQIINKLRHAEMKKRSRVTLTDEKFDAMIEADKNPRNTIAWEKKLTPVKVLDEEEKESDLEEGSEEEADSESDHEEESIESDVSYWKNREKKYLELIEMLKKAVLQERKKRENIEKTVRGQYAQFMHNQIVEIERQHKDGMEETKDILLEEQQKRLEVMANLSNINMNELKQGFEKKIWELTSKNTAIEKELSDCHEQVNIKSTDLLASEEELTLIKVAHGELKMELEKRTEELAASKQRRSRASTRLSVDGYDKEEAIQDLVKENEEGKILIRSLMEEAEDYRSQVESTQEDCERLKEDLSHALKRIDEVAAEKLPTRVVEADKQLEELKQKFEEKANEIDLLENKASEMLQDRGLFSEEAISFDEEKLFKFTEGLLQHLREVLNRKDEQIAQLTTDIEKEIEDKLSIKDHLSSVKSNFERATAEASSLCGDLTSKTEVLKKLQLQNAEAEQSRSRQLSDAENKVNNLKETHAEEVEALKNQLKSKDEIMSAKLLSGEDRVKEMESEVVEKKTFEQQLLKETDRLHAEVEKLKKENLEVKRVSFKRSSDASGKLREIEILTQDRDDLRMRVDTLGKKLTDIAKEKEKVQEELREKIADATSVQSMTELMDLRALVTEKDINVKKLASEKDVLLAEKDNLQKELEEMQNRIQDFKKEKDNELSCAHAENEKLKSAKSKSDDVVKESSSKIATLEKHLKDSNQEVHILKDRIKKNENLVKKYKSDMENDATNHDTEREALLEQKKEMEIELTKMRKAIMDLEKEIKTSVASSKNADEKISDFEKELSKKQKELEQVQAYFSEFKNKTEEQVDETRRNHEAEIKSVKQSRVKDMKQMQSENESLSKLRDEEKSGLKEELDEKQKELEQVQASISEFKTKTKEHIEETRENHESEIKSIKRSHGKEMKQLQSELVQSKKIVAAKEKELNNFRENRDKIVKALEVQISNDTETNIMLKENLDEQMADVAKLKSEKSAVLAENEEMKKLLDGKKDDLSQMKKIESETVLLQLSPQVHLEPLSTQPQTGSLSRKQWVPKAQPSSETVCDAVASKEETQTEKKTKTKEARGVKRGSSAGSRGSRRGKRVTRAATPLPEVPSGDEEKASSPPKKLRSALKSTEKSRTSSLLKEVEEGVLDDSELLKETGNARQFPQPTMEIDVTPDLSKKAAKARKRAVTKEDPDPELEKTDSGSAVIQRSMRRKLRGTDNVNASNDAASLKMSDEETPMLSASKNLAKVGAMIKNSPVGQVFKAISPAGSSPKKSSRRAPEGQQQKRTRKMVKLHPDDISSPLEATPTSDTGSEFPAVSHNPARKLRTLRSRK